MIFLGRRRVDSEEMDMSEISMIFCQTVSRKLRDAVAGNPAAQESALDTLLSLLLDTARVKQLSKTNVWF